MVIFCFLIIVYKNNEYYQKILGVCIHIYFTVSTGNVHVRGYLLDRLQIYGIISQFEMGTNNCI